MVVLSKVLSDIKKGEIVLLVSPASEIMKTDLEVLKYISKRIKHGVYVTINQPYVTLKRLLKDSNINSKNLFFIDLISSTVSQRSEKTSDCLFINSPTGLTELGIAIIQLLASMPDDDKFIFIDNLAAFLIYNDFDVISEFSHFLITKMRLNNVMGIIMSVEEEVGSKLISTIGSFCNRVIRIKN